MLIEWFVFEDNHPPVYNSCPSTITAYEEDVVSWSEPEVVDNVGIKSKKFISDYPNNSKFKEGAHVLMYVATDHEGNVGVCKFLVSVYKKGIYLDGNMLFNDN